MSTYQIIKNELGIESVVKTDDDGKVWIIPTDPANSDYAAYLATLAADSAPQA
jgi:hypothetical protein